MGTDTDPLKINGFFKMNFPNLENAPFLRGTFLISYLFGGVTVNEGNDHHPHHFFLLSQFGP